MLYLKKIIITENTNVNYIIKTLLVIINRWGSHKIVLNIEVYENDKKNES